MNTTGKPTAPTLDQQRAEHALNQIQRLAKETDYDGMYVSYVSALPATIVMNGIGQALATELAKDKGKGQSHRRLFDHLASWLTNEGQPLSAVRGAAREQPQSVLTALMESQQTYVNAQAEAMAYINWLKQFARAFLNDTGDSNDGE